jgi:HPt (histidine-containing phosphotransfer) domain-containing protein
MSLSVSVYGLTGFCQFNSGPAPINHIIELIQYTTFVFNVHSGFGFLFAYLGIPAGRYHRIAGPFHICLLLLLWTTNQVVLDSFVARELPTPLSRQIIHNIGANPDRLKKYLELLLEDMGTQIGVMESACKVGDAKALQAAGHTVKGLARALADPEAGRIAEDIENQAKTENIQTVNEQLSRLKTLYETLIQSR